MKLLLFIQFQRFEIFHASRQYCAVVPIKQTGIENKSRVFRPGKPITLANLKTGVIVKSGVSALELGGDLVNCFHLDSIFEFHPGNHLRKIVEPTQASPVFLGTHPQLEHHVQHAVTG